MIRPLAALPAVARPVSLAAACAAALVATGAHAHSKDKGSTPADGAVLTAPPETVVLAFDAPMRITLLTLTSDDGRTVTLGRTDAMAPVTELVATPEEPLTPGTWTVDWRGLASDGHPMAGGFTFSVDG